MRAVLDRADRGSHGYLRELLALAQPQIAAEHIDHEKVQAPVTIDVGKIHPHGAGAHVAQGQARREPETAFAVVEPKAVRGPEIVAHVEIGKAIIVEVPESGRQAPIQRRLS